MTDDRRNSSSCEERIVIDNNKSSRFSEWIEVSLIGSLVDMVLNSVTGRGEVWNFWYDDRANFKRVLKLDVLEINSSE